MNSAIFQPIPLITRHRTVITLVALALIASGLLLDDATHWLDVLVGR